MLEKKSQGSSAKVSVESNNITKPEKRKYGQSNSSGMSDETREAGPPAKKAWRRKKKKKKGKHSVAEQTNKPSKREKCVSYLKTWKENRSEWAFKTQCQKWLISDMLDDSADSSVPDDVFTVFLEYISGSNEGTKKRICEMASEVLKEAEENETDLDDPKIKRARSIIQIS